MSALLESIENSGWATWVREANTVFAYATVLALHTFGLAFLVGISVGIALRILGVARSLPLAPLAGFFPLMWLGLWVNVASGVVLFFLDARSFLANPDFYIKMLAIVVAVRSLRSLQAIAFRDPAGLDARPMKGKILAGTVIISWAVAITAGRLSAYDGFIQRQTAAAVLVLAVVVLLGRSVAGRLLGWRTSQEQGRAAS